MQNQLAAFQLLKQLSQQTQIVANELSKCVQLQSEITKLLNVDSNIATAGLHNMLQTEPTTTPVSNQGTTFDLALWQKPNSYQGTLKCADIETGKERNLRLVLFGSKPNDKQMVLNGSVLPNGDSSLDDKIGGVFVYNRGGVFQVSAYVEATEYTNQIEISGDLADQRQTKTNPNAPDLKLKDVVPTPMFNSSGLAALGHTTAPPTQEPSPEAAGLFGNADLLTSSAAPADPQPAPAKPEDLFGGASTGILSGGTTSVEDLLK